MSGALLSVVGLSAGYGAIRVLRDVSLDIEEGSITALIGSNGAGKTTLMRTLAGLIGVGQGSIQFDGADITRQAANRRVEKGIVLVPEGRLIFADFTVEENLRIGAFAPHSRAGAEERLGEIYQLFPNLAERRRQMGATLSGGEQQRVAQPRVPDAPAERRQHAARQASPNC